MHNIKAIYRRELKAIFNSPMGYIFLVIFALINGYFFTNTFFLINQSDMRALFSVVPLIFLFFIPAVTMGLIAKEKNVGTIEVISTMPVKEYEFVIGKYLAGLTLIVVGLMFTLVHFFTLIRVGTNIDYGALLCGYFGLFLLGAFYAAVGVFSSSISENQVISFIVGIAIVITFFLMDKMLMFVPPSLTGFIQYISVDYHLASISKGVIDSRNLVYFGSMIAMFLIFTVRTIEIRKWR
ncbi:MAG: ABC transporter permease subunit [FCB group bacterium]|nr:ABC transporter permease subunit [FCB group bacterium]